MAKNANLCNNGPFYFIFFSTLLARPNKDIEAVLVLFEIEC